MDTKVRCKYTQYTGFTEEDYTEPFPTQDHYNVTAEHRIT